MKIINTSLLIFLLISFTGLHAETLNEKVARNTANCLTGHIATNSPMYQSGDIGKYLFLIKKILGDKQAISAIKKTAENLKASVQMMGGSTKEEGAWLIKTFCPGVNKILNK